MIELWLQVKGYENEHRPRTTRTFCSTLLTTEPHGDPWNRMPSTNWDPEVWKACLLPENSLCEYVLVFTPCWGDRVTGKSVSWCNRDLVLNSWDEVEFFNSWTHLFYHFHWNYVTVISKSTCFPLTCVGIWNLLKIFAVEIGKLAFEMILRKDQPCIEIARSLRIWNRGWLEITRY